MQVMDQNVVAARRDMLHGLCHLTVILFLQLADYQTTKIGLDNGASEANSVVAFIITNFGWGALLAFKVVFGVLCGIAAWRKPVFGWLLMLSYMWVVYNNIETLGGILSLR
jgi:hypothetical protein